MTPSFTGDHHRVWRRLQHGPELAFGPRQCVSLPPKKLFAPAEFDEDLDLALQDLGNDRLKQEIHRSQVISAKELFIAAIGRQEQNGCLAGSLPGANQLRRLESVQFGHANIEQNRCELMLQAQPQSLRSVVGKHELLLQRLENRFESKQIATNVIHK